MREIRGAQASRSTEPAAFWLRSLLRLGGCLMGLAFLAAAMPTSWMVTTHAELGLGVLPRAPIVEYLTRSISLLYGVHGGLLLVVARDLERYLPVIRYLGIMNVLFGVAVLAIDLYAGLPDYWALTEGPGVAVIGVLVWVLARRVAQGGEPR